MENDWILGIKKVRIYVNNKLRKQDWFGLNFLI